jgi:hypothetical protein
MRGVWLLVIIALTVDGLHHNGKRTFSGRMSPAIERLRDKIAELRNFVSGADQPSISTTTTTAPTTQTPVKGDGVDIIGQLL